jgi:hypothetical protein
MFHPNISHQQKSFFGFENSLPDKLLKALRKSEEYSFYEIIFCNIDEKIFSVLYSDKASRPNAPVNCLVSALILKSKYNWTYEQLFKNLSFNILTKTALGLDSLSDLPFDDATIFNFQNRLLSYEVETGENLLETVFSNLTQDQLKRLKLKTNIQRSDSVMASSNIRGYSRLQLLIEVLIRLWRILDDDDKELFKSKFSNYIDKSSGQYIYKILASDLPREISQIAEIYQFCQENILSKYQGTSFYKIFERIYQEHFTVVENKIEVKPKEELNSSCLQSPDDLDATFRDKRGESFRGQLINVTETCSKENPINLVCDVAVSPNNVDDGDIFNDRIDIIVDKTPDLHEVHTDGGYGNSRNDLKFEEYGITHVQTAVRGRQCEVVIEIEQTGEGTYNVKCPLQNTNSVKSGNQYKCIFDMDLCSDCQYAGKCPSVIRKSSRRYFFKHEDYLRNKRNRNLLAIPLERRVLRSNVEATIHEFACRMKSHKLKVRTAFKARVFAFTVAIGINFGRVFRYKASNTSKNYFLDFIFVQNVKERTTFLKFLEISYLIKIIYKISIYKTIPHKYFVHKLLCSF